MIETGKIQSEQFRLSCSLYELIEIWSMRGNEVDLVYMDEKNHEQTHSGIITNVYSRNGLEQIEVDSKLIIPTKNIVLVNDVSFKDYLK
jgi:hypothetical protein